MTADSRRRFRVKRMSAPRRETGISESKRLYLSLTLTAAAGAAAGAYCCRIAGRFPVTDPPTGFLSDFLVSLRVMVIYMAVCFFAGLSVGGAPLAYALCLFKGMGTGAIISGTEELIYVLPFEAAGTAAVILAARETVLLSKLISGAALDGRSPCGRDSLRLYGLKFCVITAGAAFAAALDAVIPYLQLREIN